MHPMRFGWRKNSAASSQIRYKSVFGPSHSSAKKFMEHDGRTADDQGRPEDAKGETTSTEVFDVNRSVENRKLSRLQTNPVFRHRYIAELSNRGLLFPSRSRELFVELHWSSLRREPSSLASTWRRLIWQRLVREPCVTSCRTGYRQLYDRSSCKVFTNSPFCIPAHPMSWTIEIFRGGKRSLRRRGTDSSRRMLTQTCAA